MSKSIPSILGIGAAGLILMCLMMKHLAEVTTERDRSPYAAAVESRLGSKLIGRVQIEEREHDGRLVRVVHGRVLAGCNKRKVADAAGMELWLGSMRAGDVADEVRVVLVDDDAADGAAETFVVPPPSTRR
ncbi:MAG: hypothetical protein ACE37K_14530 [Planctomycetota bacterium]